MRVLIGCEESQVVTQAFRKLGHDAWSCDIQPTRGEPAFHFQQDIMTVLHMDWDLIILHPDCTAMAVSGNRWYGKGKPRNQERHDAISWTVNLWHWATKYAPKVVLENPVGVIFQHLNPKPLMQYIQPHQFGHGETKKTGLALHNVLPLIPTNEVDGREQRVWKMAPGPNRKRDRAATYPGVAYAMADQWS